MLLIVIDVFSRWHDAVRERERGGERKKRERGRESCRAWFPITVLCRLNDDDGDSIDDDDDSDKTLTIITIIILEVI